MARSSVKTRESALGKIRNSLGEISELANADGIGSGRRLSAATEADIAAVIEQINQRRALGAEHTFAAFFGATGSGKSSLLNALTGQNIARVAIRRPTTTEPLATYSPGTAQLGETTRALDWLDIGERHLTPGIPDGLVVIDLPDIDSTVREHRAIAERLAGIVDVLVWVLDPQKYADASIHRDFLAPMAAHAEVTVVALNQVDLLSAAERESVRSDLREILARDGLANVPILEVSARTGEGVGELGNTLAEVASEAQAALARLSADGQTVLRQVADELSEDEAAGSREGSEKTVIREISTSVGREVVADAARDAYRRSASGYYGWPALRWLRKMKPDPLGRLHLGSKGAKKEATSLHRPEPSSAAARGAMRDLTRAKLAQAPRPWREVVSSELAGACDSTVRAIDRDLPTLDLRGRRPGWWLVAGFFSTLAFVATLAGLGWYVAMWVMQMFSMPRPATPEIGDGYPIPALAFLGGLVLSGLVWLIGSFAARVGAARRGAKAGTMIDEVVREHAQTTLFAPLDNEIDILKKLHSITSDAIA